MEDASASPAPESAGSLGNDLDVETGEESPAPAHVVRNKLTVSNPTTIIRGLMLRKGIMLLQPGEVKVVPAADEDEVRALFKSKTIQKIIDSGLLRISGLGPDEELVDQPTPAPPSELTDAVPVGTTGMTVGANATPNYNPDAETKIQDAGSVAVG